MEGRVTRCIVYTKESGLLEGSGAGESRGLRMEGRVTRCIVYTRVRRIRHKTVGFAFALRMGKRFGQDWPISRERPLVLPARRYKHPFQGGQFVRRGRMTTEPHMIASPAASPSQRVVHRPSDAEATVGVGVSLSLN